MTALASALPGRRRETPFRRFMVASVGLMAVASANGAFRELTYGKAMRGEAAHRLSLVPMLALFTAYTDALERRWPLPTARGALAVGAGWAAIAAAFELGLGHFAQGRPWSELLREYDLRAGRTGSLVLLASAAVPPLVRLRQRR